MHRENAEKFLALLDKYLKELIEYSSLDTDKILSDKLRLYSIERMFQLVVDTAIDLNTFLIRMNKFTVPDDNFSTFTLLGEKGVLPRDFSEELAPTVSVRNAVVHRYEKVSLYKLIIDIKSVTPLYQRYLQLMNGVVKAIK